jgi:hypothetical protein
MLSGGFQRMDDDCVEVHKVGELPTELEDSNVSELNRHDVCAICLNSLYHSNRLRKLHTTDCGHTFHETCFDKVKPKYEEDKIHRMACPCCRSETKPILKQQIRNMDNIIKELCESTRMCPLVQKSYIEIQNLKIKELEQLLQEAKEHKKIVVSELNQSNKKAKEVLETYKLSRKQLQEKLREELVEFQKKKTLIRDSKKKFVRKQDSEENSSEIGAKIKIRIKCVKNKND